MAKSKKLTKEELEVIQSMVNEFNSLKIQLGDTVITQKSLMSKVDELRDAYTEHEKMLVEKYGTDVRINVQTGDIEDVEKE